MPALPPPLAPAPQSTCYFPPRPQPDRRATLRDLYTSGLVSIFRRDSVLRVWEPLREVPRRSQADDSIG